MSVEKPTIQKSSESEGGLLPEVAELEEPIKKIIEKIKDRIEGGEYGLIIGDDAGGRIPTLILGGFIQKISENEARQKPSLIFIPGKQALKGGLEGRPLLKKIFERRGLLKLREVQERELNDHLIKYGATKDKKILIVTDTVKSGHSLKTLTTLLRSLGYNYEIATIGIEPSPINKNSFREALGGADIFSGAYYSKEKKEDRHTPRIYSQEGEKYTGVRKFEGDRSSIALKRLFSPDESPEEIQEAINQSRHDSSFVVDRLVEWYQGQKPKDDQ